MDPHQQIGKIKHKMSFGSALEHLFLLSDLKQCWTLGGGGVPTARADRLHQECHQKMFQVTTSNCS